MKIAQEADSNTAAGQKLNALVEELNSNEPYDAHGYVWAARPQSYYCEKLDISVETLRRHISKPPFVRRSAVVGKVEQIVDGKTVIAVAGKKLCLLRIGEAPDKTANDYKNIMASIWKQKTGYTATAHQKQCLWGFAQDVPGEWAVKAFKYALDHWQETATSIKIAAEARPGYKPRFYDFPNIPAIRSFHKAVVYAYVSSLMFEGKIAAEELNDAAALLSLTDPLIDHPGDETTLGGLVKLKQWPQKEPWKPLPSVGEAEAA